MDYIFNWKKSDSRYLQGKVLYVGVHKLGSIHYNVIDGNKPGKRYVGKFMDERPLYADTEEEVMDFVGERAIKWLRGLTEKPNN